MTTLEAKVRDLIKEAMNTKNTEAKFQYKSILDGALKNAKADGNREVTDEDFIKAARSEIKQLTDVKEFVKGNAEKLAEIDKKVALCEVILPQTASAEQIMEYLKANNVEKNMGACMGTLKKQFGSAFDGKIASAVVREYIG